MGIFMHDCISFDKFRGKDAGKIQTDFDLLKKIDIDELLTIINSERETNNSTPNSPIEMTTKTTIEEKINLLTTKEKIKHLWINDLNLKTLLGETNYEELITKIIEIPHTLSDIMKLIDTMGTPIKNYLILSCRNNNSENATDLQHITENKNNALRRAFSCGEDDDGCLYTHKMFKSNTYGYNL
tara:strand:- start:109 stop:660 length:552 start_codon:yes stop_codon:yes gene_type:complete